MSPEQEMEEVAQSYRDKGWVEKDHKALLGARVCHVGQRWYKAEEFGTGNVWKCFVRENDSWSRKYGRPNVELIVAYDDHTFHYLADYHVQVIA